MQLNFWKIEKNAKIIIFFIIVIAYNYAKVLLSLLFFLFFLFIELEKINFRSLNKIFLGLSITVIIMAMVFISIMLVFILIFADWVKSFHYILRKNQFKILVPRFRNLSFWIFHKRFLKKRFDILNGLFAISNVFICFSQDWKKHKTSLNFSFNNLLY